MGIRFLTDSKSLRKKVDSSAKAVYKKARLKIVIPFMSALFLINSKRTSKACINRYPKMGSLWRAPFSKLKYRVVKPPFITHDCCLFNKTFIQCMKLLPKPNLLKHLIENHDLMNQALFQYPLQQDNEKYVTHFNYIITSFPATFTYISIFNISCLIRGY